MTLAQKLGEVKRFHQFMHVSLGRRSMVTVCASLRKRARTSRNQISALWLWQLACNSSLWRWSQEIPRESCHISNLGSVNKMEKPWRKTPNINLMSPYVWTYMAIYIQTHVAFHLKIRKTHTPQKKWKRQMITHSTWWRENCCFSVKTHDTEKQHTIQI